MPIGSTKVGISLPALDDPTITRLPAPASSAGKASQASSISEHFQRGH
jgi:hypothetical protein